MVSEDYPVNISTCCLAVPVDPGISSCVEELFEALAPNPCCHVCLHSHIVPTALDILGSVSLQLPQGLVAVSYDVCVHMHVHVIWHVQGMLEVLAHVVHGCVAGDSARVPPPFIQEIFPVATKKILDSSDSAVLQVIYCIDEHECVISQVACLAIVCVIVKSWAE